MPPWRSERRRSIASWISPKRFRELDNPTRYFASLSHFLRTELGLSGLAILTTEPEVVPSVQLRTAWPKIWCRLVRWLNWIPPVAHASGRTSPGFSGRRSPVRCSIESILKLPTDHPAYCIPFNIGRKMQTVIHMLLAPGSEWTEKTRQLAQTYVNSAQSVLTTLHLLAEAEMQSMTDALTGLYNRRSMDSCCSVRWPFATGTIIRCRS